MHILKRVLPVILLLIIGYAVLRDSFGRVLDYPNEYCFGGSGDGLKNYFTPAFYARYDSGWHFSGMNHPYGEHVAFTDNQPLLAFSLSWIERHIAPISHHTVGIINYLMILSLAMCMLLMYQLARKAGLPAWYAVPVAVLITMLSPQIHRLTGHYALMYPVFIPLTWLCAWNTASARRPWPGVGGMVGMIVLFGLIHPYHLMTTALFAGGFWLVRAWVLRRAGRLAWGRALVISLILVAGPVLVFQGIMGLTDPVEDRPESPFGFFTYRAYWHSVFLPVQGPLADAWRRFAWKWIVPDMEGFSYTGLVVTVVVVLSMVRMLRYVRSGHYGRVLHTALPGQMGPALGAGILLLLFSMAWPFTMGLQGLVDLLGPLRQFRSLGRFAWAFYYVGALYAAWYLYVAGRRLRMKGLGSYAWGIWGVALVFWAWEGQIHLKIHTQAAQKTRGTNVINGKKAFDSGDWMLANGINPQDYQAVLPLPVFNIGSEKFIPQFHTPEILRQAIKVSYDTGLPMFCGAMSRTSLRQAGNLIQVTGDMLLRRTILDDLRDRRPLLILRQNATPMAWGDQALLAYARLLVTTEAFSWYALDLSVLEGTRQEVFAAFEARKDSLYPAGPLLLSRPVRWYIFDGFDGGTLSPFGVETRRAPTGKLVLYDGPVQDTSVLDLSVWVRINRRVPGMPAMYVREYTPDGAQIQAPDVSGMFTTNIVGEWARIAQTVKPRTPGNRLLIYLEDHDIEAESFLLMPARTQTYIRLPGDTVLMYNNFYLAR